MDVLISALAPTVAGILLLLLEYRTSWFVKIVSKRIAPLLSRRTSEDTSFSVRMAALTKSLTDASSQVDDILDEMEHITQERHLSAQRLAAELYNLETQKRELEKRIEQLQDVPIPVAEHFASLMESGEKKSARRDYLLFAAGFVLSAVLSIILAAIGVG